MRVAESCKFSLIWQSKLLFFNMGHPRPFFPNFPFSCLVESNSYCTDPSQPLYPLDHHHSPAPTLNLCCCNDGIEDKAVNKKIPKNLSFYLRNYSLSLAKSQLDRRSVKSKLINAATFVTGLHSAIIRGGGGPKFL